MSRKRGRNEGASSATLSDPRSAVFESLNASSQLLMKVGLEFPTGSASVDPSHDARKSLSELVAWKEYEEWLDSMLIEYKTAVAVQVHRHRSGGNNIARNADNDDDDNGGDDDYDDDDEHDNGGVDSLTVEQMEIAAAERLERLQLDYVRLATDRARDELLIQRLVESKHLVDMYFGESTDESSIAAKESLKDILKERDERSSLVAKESQALRQTEEEITRLQIQVSEQQEKNRRLWRDIEALREGRERRAALEPLDPSLESALAQEKLKNTIVRFVFQSLVCESKVNWANDPLLRNTMLSLEYSPLDS